MKQDKKPLPKPTGTTPHQQRSKTGWIIAAALLFLGLAISVFLISDQFAQKTTIGIPQFQDNHIELIDQNGIARNQDDFADRPIALFFGFTYCPDVCPTTLTTLAAARDDLESAGIDTKALQILFITVDPERDTPEQLKQYLSLFDADVTGLTGSPDKVRSVLQQFGVYAQKNDQGDGDYLYDHSAAVFLYRDDGSFKGTIVHNEPIAFITEKLKSIL
ncbi:SCO family protein [Alphaproteobacteria bacterium]|jgi:protein SCO1/2|nr:SCO family protein [Alphaproteobacteria bacterium]MDC0337467.1 SCO family protein [Alphaproteobacteria bacterium]